MLHRKKQPEIQEDHRPEYSAHSDRRWHDGSLYAIERTNNTDETALENLTSLLMFDMNKATTKAAVYDALNTYFKEVQNYGIHYYARED